MINRLVVQRKGDRVRNTYYIDGKRVSAKAYREASDACSSFDCHQTTSTATHTRFYSVGRP